METVQNVQPQRPIGQLKTDRSLGIFILLSIVTLGIYDLVYFSKISTDINIIASRYDGKKTMHFILVLLLAVITLGIVPMVWFHNISGRIGGELRRRGIPVAFDASTYWLWSFLGAFIIVGPWVYIHKLSKAMNALAIDYNTKG